MNGMAFWGELKTLVRTGRNSLEDVFSSNKSTFQGARYLAISSLISQGIIFLSSPILTRLLTPDDFGIYSLFVSIFSILLPVVTLRFEFAILIANQEKERQHVLWVSYGITIFSSLLLLLILVIFDPLSLFDKYREYRNYMLWLPITLLVGGIVQIFTFQTLRQKEFQSVGISRIWRGGLTAISQILFGVLNMGPVGLILGNLSGKVAGWISLLKREFSLLISPEIPSIVESFQLLRKYIKFPAFTMTAAVIDRISLQIPVFLLIWLLGTQETGWYGLANRIVLVPLSFIGSAIGESYLAQMSEVLRNNPRKAHQYFLKTLKLLFFIGVMPISLLGLLAPWGIGKFFGDQWGQAGRYIQILMPAYCLQFAISPLSHTLNIAEKQDWLLYWDIGRIGLILVSALGVFHFWDTDVALLSAISGALVVTYASLIIITMKALQQFQI